MQKFVQKGKVSMLRVGNNMLTLNVNKTLVGVYYIDVRRLVVRSGFTASRVKRFLCLPSTAWIDEAHRHATDAAMQRLVLKEINNVARKEHGLFIKALYTDYVPEGQVIDFTQVEYDNDYQSNPLHTEDSDANSE